MLLRTDYVGKLNLSNGIVDITDPCYDRDTWCRKDNVQVKPGIYNCYAGICVEGDDFDKGKCFTATIVHEDFNENEIPHKSWKRIGMIGVDAGLAGFFPSPKSDFNDEEWAEFCGGLNFKQNAFLLNNDLCTGFFTFSGWGDGQYNVYAYYRKNEIVALEIRF